MLVLLLQPARVRQALFIPVVLAGLVLVLVLVGKTTPISNLVGFQRMLPKF